MEDKKSVEFCFLPFTRERNKTDIRALRKETAMQLVKKVTSILATGTPRLPGEEGCEIRDATFYTFEPYYLFTETS